MRLRKINKWWANKCGFFWIPCPRCTEEFGGHELPRGPHWAMSEGQPNKMGGVVVCPDCNKDLENNA